MKIRIILSLLLVITIACSKDSTEPETLSPESTISMALDYQSREYELGEVIEATLTITEKNPAADYFLLNTSCNGGKAVATVDGHELQWQAEQQIPYEIVNDEFSSKVLRPKPGQQPNSRSTSGSMQSRTAGQRSKKEFMQ